MTKVTELSIEDFTKYVCDELLQICQDILLSNPNTKSKYPCGIVSLPLKIVDRTIMNGNTPVRWRFSITIEWWSDKKYTSISYCDKTDSLLRNSNFTRTNTSVDSYDDVTKKHRYGGSYEVFFNGLTNSFERVK